LEKMLVTCFSTAPEQVPDDLRIERRAATGDAADGIEELVQIRYALLEQVAEAVGPVGEQLECVRSSGLVRPHERLNSTGATASAIRGRVERAHEPPLDAALQAAGRERDQQVRQHRDEQVAQRRAQVERP
jgi:hypothetical protein